MSLVAGSYERFIWGFTLKSQSQSLTLTPLFSYPSHLSLIKSVAISGSVVASGGADDTIHLYNLSASSSLGSLHHHSATVTSLSFYTPPELLFPRNLVSADAEGTVCLYDADGFVHLKTLPSVHRKAVNDLAIHPSGKLALTVGRDECLAMVNLVRGRRSFCCRLDKEASLVKYDSDGGKFFLAMEEKVSVHEAEDARLLLEFECQKRVLCAAYAKGCISTYYECEPLCNGNVARLVMWRSWVEILETTFSLVRNGLLYTGGEDRNITAWDINSGKVAYSIEEAHATRVKGIVVLTDNDGSAGGEDPYLVTSASSDGVIRVWDVRMAATEKPNPLSECKTQSRLTCLAGSTLKWYTCLAFTQGPLSLSYELR
ncbi:hypothetical protein TanjilG_16632 [Lupinus angustifolius]|uniref:Anaphase-promoting complex subunit 4 WD40 domain-containing protein n=1 Tax=Lupinus angustifolius TaxID=3871 RepID=A0A4P1QZC6_LUPAN|nr:hypothetical protein TanjilG_16632 [Lupinus angustifolius]